MQNTKQHKLRHILKSRRLCVWVVLFARLQKTILADMFELFFYMSPFCFCNAIVAIQIAISQFGVRSLGFVILRLCKQVLTRCRYCWNAWLHTVSDVQLLK